MTQAGGSQATAMTTAPAAAPFEFTSPEDDEFLNGLLYGDFGVGKTTAAGSAARVPQMQDVLYIAAEAGEKVLKEYANEGHLVVVRVNKYATVARIYEWMVAHVRARNAGDEGKLLALAQRIPGALNEDGTPKIFRTVVLDSLTEIQALLMYQLLGIDITVTRLDLPPDTAEFKEWGQSSEMIKLLIRSFRDLDLNVIIVCSMEEKEDERKRQLKRLLLPGKLATSVQGFLDFVGFLDKATTDSGPAWRLHLTSGQSFHAKNRFGPKAPPHIDLVPGTPVMQMLFDLNNPKTPKKTETPKQENTNQDASSTAPAPNSGSSTPTAARTGTGTPGTRAPVKLGGRGPVRPAGR